MKADTRQHTKEARHGSLRSTSGKVSIGFILTMAAIFGLLGIFAVPNFLEARRKSCTRPCIPNLRNIDSALQQFHIEEPSNLVLIALFSGTTTSDRIPANYLKNPASIHCPLLGKNEPYIITNWCPICPGHMRGLKKFKDHCLYN